MKKVFVFGLILSLLFASFDFTRWLPAQAHPASGQPQAAGTSTVAAAPKIADSPTPSRTPTQTTVPTITLTPTITNTPTNTPAAYDRPLLAVTSNSYDANKAYAGGKFTLTSVFKNQGQKTAFNIVVTFTNSDVQPLTNGGVIVVASIAPGDSATVTQDFFIKSSIAVYHPSIDVSVEYKDAAAASFTQKFQAPISVYWLTQSSATPTMTATVVARPRIVVMNYTVDQATLQPGSNFTLTMNVQNMGSSLAHSVTMTIGGASSSTSTTTSTNFLPIGTSNIRVLGDMAAQKSLQVQQSFVVNSTLTPGAYPVTLSFAYKDDLNANQTDDQVITLLVYLVPSIEVGFYEDVGTFTQGTKGNLPIQVVNLSSSSILLGDISVQAEAATLTNSSMFIGTLDGGGTFTIDTEFTPSKNGAQQIKVNIAYQDNFKNTQTITRTLSVNVGNGNSNGQSGTGNGSGTGTQANNSIIATQMAARAAAQAANSGSEDFWQIILRFIRGMIGFDSAPQTSAQPSFTFPSGGFNGGQNPSQSGTATPAR